jgi:hypothetical protein
MARSLTGGERKKNEGKQVYQICLKAFLNVVSTGA